MHVRTKVASVSKSFATVRASVRLLASVCAHMTLEQPWPREVLSAYRTLVRCLMREKVHTEISSYINKFTKEALDILACIAVDCVMV